ncbi:transporter substrate-binding domain-containing protein [Tatumella citrea]|uniref:ABC transporter substrate-binding protein n=1 Tax=Tatumella citrea TaxID=53336 RepID=A0A1Y0LGN4_TATCI|nr:transporter substrate-binding domain-containing protein [Tatumella citrea]ARU92877.1 ABC transporter substrate-binding protein [Tatumella citrea]ARU96915.1 ABC transporter substrate-binding protein [Tatumella citrea]
MKSILRLACLAAPLFFGLAQAATLQPGHLLVGSDLTYPPYNYLDQGKPAGFDAEFINLISAPLKLTPVVVDTRFASLILGLKSNRFDIVASTLYVTPERAQQVDFLPYMKTGGSLLVQANSTFLPQKPEDLCGKRVSSIKGGAWIARLNKLSTDYCQPKGLGAISVLEFPTSPEAAQALLSRAVDVQYEDAAVAKATVEKTGKRLKISSSRIIYPVVVGLAVNKNNPELLSQLKASFAQKVKDGSYQVLLHKYNLQMPDNSEVAKALAGTL